MRDSFSNQHASDPECPPPLQNKKALAKKPWESPDDVHLFHYLLFTKRTWQQGVTMH